MKKMLFLAAIGMAGIMSAKSNSEAVEVSKPEKAFQLCGVMVTYYDSLGSPTGQTWFTSDQPTLSDCQSYQRGVISNLTAQGYKVKAQLSASVE